MSGGECEPLAAAMLRDFARIAGIPAAGMDINTLIVTATAYSKGCTYSEAMRLWRLYLLEHGKKKTRQAMNVVGYDLVRRLFYTGSWLQTISPAGRAVWMNAYEKGE